MVNIDVRRLTSDTLDSVESIIAENKGTCSLKVLLSDSSENINIEMFSRKYQVEPNNILIDRVKQLEGVGYKFV